VTIRIWDYRREYEAEADDIRAGIEKVLRSGCLILGESGKAFEAAFAAYCRRSHGMGVNSGTDALFLALKALDIGVGDEVITVANTAVPTVAAIVATGATPRFVDIDARTYLMDVGQLAAAVTPRTRCVLPVHLYGQCVDMMGVERVARQHKLHVIEDCAQSHGATQHGRLAGAMSDVAAFSFYPTKILGAYGDAGMVVTDDDAIAARVRRLRIYGMEERYYAVEHGYNSRLDEIQAEILLRKLPRIAAYISRRQAVARRYDERLAGASLALPHTIPGNTHVYYLYVVRHARRDEIIRRLADRGIQATISYPWPVHTMSGYAFLGGRPGDLPETEHAGNEIFSLPMYPTLTEAEQDRVCDALIEICRDL
jgi:aminotransferase EvaB